MKRHKKKIITSFDIFDTCIIRTCGSPENFLQLLSVRAFKEKPSENMRRLFLLGRQQAEQRACQNNPYANIFDIYSHLEFSHKSLLAQEELAQVEMDLQKEVARPVLHIQQQIAKLRQNGCKIVYISDMYLPKSVLSEILTRYDFLHPSDLLYVSCDEGCTKANGELFHYIKEKECFDYRNWHHYGDNLNSDIKVPSRLGIHTHRVINGYSIIQNNWLGLPQNGDYNSTSIIAGISRSLILSTQNNKRSHLILDIIAPLYCSFAYNIIYKAKLDGIKRLFFLSRDTAQLYQVALRFQSLFPELEMRYIRISRDAINNTPEDTLIDFFKQEGLACHDLQCAIVDSNTTGKTLYTINKLLHKNGFNSVNRYNVINYLTNNIYSYILSYDKTYNPDHDYWLIDYNGSSLTFILPVMIEAVFSANSQHKTIAYINEDGIINPVFDSGIDDDSIEQMTPRVVEQHQTELLKQYTDIFISNNLHHYSESILHQIALPTLFQFINYPHKEILQAFDGLSFIHQGVSKPIIEKQSLIKLLRFRGRNTLWPRGSVVYSLPEPLSKLFIKTRLKNNPLI